MSVDLLTISEANILAIPDKRAAITACVKLSGLPPKAVAHTLSIEYSHFIKMTSSAGGDSLRHFPHEKELKLMEICRNEIPLTWLLLNRGYPSTRQILEMQQELDNLRAEVVRLRSEARAVVNVFKCIGD